MATGAPFAASLRTASHVNVPCDFKSLIIPTAITPLTQTPHPTTLAQQKMPRSPPTATADISTAAYCNNEEPQPSAYTTTHVHHCLHSGASPPLPTLPLPPLPISPTTSTLLARTLTATEVRL